MNCLRLLQLHQNKCSQFFKVASTARCISGHHFKYLESQDRWKQRDGLSKQWELIYKGPMETGLNVITTYLTVSSTAFLCGGLYYALFLHAGHDWDAPIVVGEDVVIANSPMEAYVYIGTFIAFHIAVKLLISKLVLRLYQDGDEYTAVYRGHWYNSITKHKFHLNEVSKLGKTFFVSWGDSRFKLGSKKGILLEPYFKTPEYLNCLLGKKYEAEE